MNEMIITKDNGEKITIDRDKFIGRIQVRADGKVQVVTILSDGNESTKWASWQEIKRTVEEVLAERAQEAKEDER